VSQDLYVGDSEQQVGGLTDLLMHFDEFAKRQFSLDSYLPPPAGEAASVGQTGPQNVASATSIQIDSRVDN
jgi:hypothetical protein